MPFSLDLPQVLKAAGWKAKIQDNEAREVPHVTVRFRRCCWRISLRDGGFLDVPEPWWPAIPDGVLAALRANWGSLRRAWDRRYPENPVGSRR